MIPVEYCSYDRIGRYFTSDFGGGVNCGIGYGVLTLGLNYPRSRLSRMGCIPAVATYVAGIVD